MQVKYHKYGKTIRIGELSNQRAVEFTKAVRKHRYARLIRGVEVNGDEGVVFDACPEIPQFPLADIRRTERIRVTFPANSNKKPDVRALRADFPDELQHLNLTIPGEPKSLCLFEEDYSELKRSLTPEIFLKRVFSWLSRAAADEQHFPDQPLEPFLLGHDRIIFNVEVFSEDFVDRILAVVTLAEEPRPIYRVEPLSLNIDSEKLPKAPFFIACPILTKPWHSRIINQTPLSVGKLHNLLKTVDVDLVGKLQCKTIETFHKRHNEILLDYSWLLLVRLPKTREAGGEIETLEDWAFFLHDTIGELGIKLGALGRQEGSWAQCLPDYATSDLDSSLISTGRTVHTLNRNLARRLGGIKGESTSTITAVGAGALGSHLIMNLARQGVGKWIIIDHDQVLPHNHARYALSPRFEGYSKAKVLAQEIGILLNDKEAAKSIAKDIFEAEVESDDVKEAFQKADHILDLSVSPAVSRHLALLGGDMPRTSVFLLQHGRFLVIISEGKGRKARLDDLEVQLGVESVENKRLKGLLRPLEGTRIRYSGSCRDVTTVLAQDVVSMQAGIASQFLKNNMLNESPSICVWSLSERDLTVDRTDIVPHAVAVRSIGEWEIRISEYAIRLMRKYREERLPNETGGVLLGAIDVPARIIYVGGILPSPADSKEWPMTYVRGIKGLRKMVTSIKEDTGEEISYVGEWHSHPNGRGSTPSQDDFKALKWLAGHMSEERYPGLMLIQGDSEDSSIILEFV